MSKKSSQSVKKKLPKSSKKEKKHVRSCGFLLFKKIVEKVKGEMYETFVKNDFV